MSLKLKLYLFSIYTLYFSLLIFSSFHDWAGYKNESVYFVTALSLAVLIKFLNSDAIKDLQSSVNFYLTLPIFLPAIYYLPTHHAMICIALSTYLLAKKEVPFFKRVFNLSSLGISGFIVSLGVKEVIDDLNVELFEPHVFLTIICSGIIFNLINSMMVYVAASLEKNKFDADTFLAFVSSIKSSLSTLFLAVINIIVFSNFHILGVAVTSFIFIFFKPAMTYHQIFNNELIAYTNFVLGLLKKKDPVTHLHSERVKYWTVMLAKQMKLSMQEIRDLSLAASWHDIGKIDIPEGLLTKPGKLTNEEFELIKQHPEVGYNMVKEIHFFKKYLPVIRHHHEAYDGSGYPLGLKENEITLHARMMCITDSFDAMTADRPYRTGMHMREAVAELVRCKGKQFDPKLVDIFIEALKKNFGKDFERWDTEKEKILSAS